MHTEAHSIGIPVEWVPTSKCPDSMNPAVLIIGQNPGAEEDREGSNFISSVYGWAKRPSAGKTLRESYIPGIQLEQRCTLYLGNGARCGPRSTTNAGVYNACIPYLLEDLRHILDRHCGSKTALLFCSAPAIKAFFKATSGESITTLRKALTMQGHTVEISTSFDSYTVPCFFTYHPAYLNRGNFRLIRNVALHLDCLSRWLDSDTASNPVPLSLTKARPPS
jgi:uracil-DNA glycosylase